MVCQVKHCVCWCVFNVAREIGFTSINANIIYGLPQQTLASVQGTIEKVRELTEEDLALRQHILNLMCHYQTTIIAENYTPFLDLAKERMADIISDSLVEIRDNTLKITEAGKPFCATFAPIWLPA